MPNSPKDSLNQQQVRKETKNASASQKALNDNIAKLTEILGTFGKTLSENTKALSDANKLSEKTINAQDKKDKEQKEKDKLVSQASLLHNINSLVNALRDMKGLSPGQRGTRRDLTGRAKDLQERALAGEDISQDYRQLKYEKYRLEAERDQYNNSALGLMVNTMNHTRKLEGAMSTGLGAITGFNPVLLSAFGLDKFAKWAGGKFLDRYGSNLSAFGKVINPFSPIKWKKDIGTAINETKNEDDDGLSNGTGKLKSKNQGIAETTLNYVKGIYEKLHSDKVDENDKEKKDKEEGGILATIMKVVGTVIGIAASGAVALLAVAGKDLVTKMLSKVLETVGFSEETAKALAGPVAGMLPGAILGFKLGGFHGAIIGGLISGGYFAIKHQVDQITDLLNGKVVPDNELNLLGDALEGAITGGMLGIPFGPPGMITGAVLGAIGGAIVGLVKEAQNEANKAEDKAKKQHDELKKQASEMGVVYSGENANAQLAERTQNLETYLEQNPNSGLADTAKKMIKENKKVKEVANDYEKERAKVEKKALKKYGVKDLSQLNLDQLEDLMDDDDAEFEAYLYQLQNEGIITNDAATRESLRKVWTDNENWTWGENKKSKQAVMNKIYALRSQNTASAEEIIADGNAAQILADGEKTRETITSTTANGNGGNTTQINSAQIGGTKDEIRHNGRRQQ